MVWRTRVQAVLIVACLVAGTTAAVVLQRTTRVVLSGSGHYSECVGPSQGNGWARLSHGVTEFGVDAFRLRGGATRIRLRSVSLVGVVGRLRLVRAVVIPGAGAREGFPWPSKTFGGSPGWSSRIAVPGEVSGKGASSGDGTGWQLVIGVQPAGAGGSAQAIRISYSSGQRTRSVDGLLSIAMYRNPKSCGHQS
jgi:hypothetical protein